MTVPLPDIRRKGALALRSLGEIRKYIDEHDAVVIGPGLGRHHETRELVQRLVARTPEMTARRNNAWWNHDVCDQLHRVTAPTLVLQREGDRIVRAGASRYVSERIPGGQLAMLPGSDHLMWFGDTDAVISRLEQFVDASLARR